jgi:erythromycin esterase
MKKPDTDTVHLELGKPIERELGGKAIHHYLVRLEAGSFLRGNAEQKGVDVVVTVFGPDQQKLGAFDGQYGAQGPEPFEIEPQATGTYRIQVGTCDTNAAPGKYEISITEVLTPKQQAARLAAERVRTEAVTKWFARNAIPLTTVEAEHGFADMKPLEKVIGDARIVALGEATHGTREFFQLKHRMLEFLVTEMGFTAFGIEATMPECFDINDYVLTGDGDPLKALAGQYFWTWDTREVLEMIQWMRRYNADPSHTRKVKFYGFDMQSPARAARVTRDYLRRVDPQFADSVAAELGLLANPLASQGLTLACLPVDRKQAVLIVAQSVPARFDALKRDYVEKTSLEEWSRTRQHARVLAQCAQSNSADNLVRDPSMAENVAWILEQEGPGSRIVIWAHNGHVGVNRAGDWTTMGYHLRRRFGSAMYVFGFAFNQGSFQAVEMTPHATSGLRPFTVGPAAEGTLENLMSRAGLTIAAVNLHDLPTEGPVAEWFSKPCSTRVIGSGYPVLQEYQSVDARQVFDGVMFVETTSAAQPTSGANRPPSPRLRAPANLDFEDVTVGDAPDPSRIGLPVDWTVPGRLDKFDFRVVSSTENPYHGKRCVEISRPAGKHCGEIAGTISQRIEAEPYRGKKIRLRAAVRVEVSGTGSQAQLWLRCSRYSFGPQAVAFFDCMFDRPVTSPEWRIYEITAEVGPDVETIDYGCALIGDGKAWFDAFSIEAIEK